MTPRSWCCPRWCRSPRAARSAAASARRARSPTWSRCTARTTRPCASTATATTCAASTGPRPRAPASSWCARRTAPPSVVPSSCSTPAPSATAAPGAAARSSGASPRRRASPPTSSTPGMPCTCSPPTRAPTPACTTTRPCTTRSRPWRASGSGAEDGLRAVLHAANTLTSQGGLVVYVGGPVGDDDARTLSALRQPGSAGAAMVVDPEAFAGRSRKGAADSARAEADPRDPAVLRLDDDPGRRPHHAGARLGRRGRRPGRGGPVNRVKPVEALLAAIAVDRGHPSPDHLVHAVVVVPAERAARRRRRPGGDGPAPHHRQPPARRRRPGRGARVRRRAGPRPRTPLARPPADPGDRPRLRGAPPGGPAHRHQLHRPGPVQPRHDPGHQPAHRPHRRRGRRDRRDLPQPGAGRHPPAVGLPRGGDELR